MSRGKLTPPSRWSRELSRRSKYLDDALCGPLIERHVTTTSPSCPPPLERPIVLNANAFPPCNTLVLCWGDRAGIKHADTIDHSLVEVPALRPRPCHPS